MKFKLLAIGNSFSVNALKYLYQILSSFGINDIVIGNLYIGGCSIETHYNNAINNYPNYIYIENRTGKFKEYNGSTIYDALVKEDWDFVTLQQVSGLSGIKETYDEKIDYILNYVKQNVKNKDVKFAWHMTWAYENNADHPDFPKYDNNQFTMYNKIIQTVQEKICSNKNFDFVIPSGTAIQNARSSYVGDTFTNDGFHLENLGEFIAGMTFIQTLTNWDYSLMNLDLIPYKFNRYLDVVKEAVSNAVKKPFEVTKSIYTLIKEEKYIDYDLLKQINYDSHYKECTLDIYEPKKEKFDVVIHFHGGGLTSGTNDDESNIYLGTFLSKRGILFTTVNYRMYPNYQYPDFLNDAAKAIKYIIEKYQKRINKIIISGQSAGAYIGMMLCFNKEYLLKQYVDTNDIAGWLIESGQPTTHFTILEKDNLHPSLVRIDERSPFYYVNENVNFKDVELITYTKDIELRKEQMILLYKTIKCLNSNLNVSLRILEGEHCINSVIGYRNHYPYADLLIEYLNKIS